MQPQFKLDQGWARGCNVEQHQKNSLCKLIHRALGRSVGRDLIDTTERVADVVEMFLDMTSEDEGLTSLPAVLRPAGPHAREAAEDPWDFRENVPESKAPIRVVNPPPARNAVVPAKPAQRTASVIALPGSPEFAESDPSNVAQPGTISAVDVRRKTGRIPGKSVAPVQEWTETDLIDTINHNTPEFIDFEIEGPEGGLVKIRVARNTLNLPGIGAQLTYRHASVDQNDGWLVAKVDFSLYKREIDLNLAMNGAQGIHVQLRGKYRRRDQVRIEPHMPPEQPLRLDMATQPGDQAAIDNYQQGVVVNDPRGTVKADLERANASLTPASERPAKR